MGQDSVTIRDKGTEVPSLSRDIGTAQNLAMGQDGTGFLTGCPVLDIAFIKLLYYGITSFLNIFSVSEHPFPNLELPLLF
jgi:hypothetical protein